MKKPELVFIPTPGMGHLVSAVEAAKLLVDLNDRLSITVLIIKPLFDSKVTGYVRSVSATTSFSNSIRFIDLPQPPKDELANIPPANFFITYIESHKPLVKEAVLTLVFLCFGSLGSFGEDQVQEIARALEQSGHRFLWSLRKPQPKGTISSPTDYSNLEEVLPEGFLDRTVEIGKVIGWAPQVSVLAHPAVGGFVSHCGWNSTLESILFGVPIAAWPLYAEQQFNAFQLVKELGLAVEIKMDYNMDLRLEIEPPIVTAEEIKRGMVGLMEPESDVRKKVKVMSEKSRKASVKGGGSSHSSLQDFISHVLGNMP
ncbi:hypothetical protein SLEP1_g37242 [Rubroshorea leprosula]|uniref:Uncharacterized protein n=1 Tax=Rubroshorea leprosula TaxID=152421 RepID=A0AAV5KUA7_9ROSI|nr:hypothetical protein SLEP1_g37242 [Rubroshorea leprosula]